MTIDDDDDTMYFLIRTSVFRRTMLYLSSALKTETSGFSEMVLEERVLMSL